MASRESESNDMKYWDLLPLQAVRQDDWCSMLVNLTFVFTSNNLNNKAIKETADYSSVEVWIYLAPLFDIVCIM
jgi:hypothetical protein